jgi:outer membrane cobalamin receptor
LAKYNIYDKIILETNVNVIGGIMAIDTNTSSSIDLDAVFDLSLMGTYLLSDQFSIFAKFNNIFSQEYQLINRYPVRGFQAIGGISYTF